MSDLFRNHIVGFPTRWLIYGDKKDARDVLPDLTIPGIVKLPALVL